MSSFVTINWNRASLEAKIISNILTIEEGDSIRRYIEGLQPTESMVGYDETTLGNEPTGRTAVLNMEASRQTLQYHTANYQAISATRATIQINSVVVNADPTGGANWQIRSGETLYIGGQAVKTYNLRSFRYTSQTMSLTSAITIDVLPAALQSDGQEVEFDTNLAQITSLTGTAPAPLTEDDRLKSSINDAWQFHNEQIAIAKGAGATLARSASKTFFEYSLQKRLFLMSAGISELWSSMNLTQKRAAAEYMIEFDTGQSLLDANPRYGSEVEAWALEKHANASTWDTWIDSNWMIIEDADVSAALATVGVELPLIGSTTRYYVVSSVKSTIPFDS